eukprot:TRINITY_DN6568_c0_g1_i1.p1 TRINITY_DN6568_c0_g1~~TRINITY_DN6568_c0_g1_i1.p1  ORF type:complete len:1095 (+),score=144.55 TRINITY_DN6568_c0_g1_i1:43-3285(+)
MACGTQHNARRSVVLLLIGLFACVCVRAITPSERLAIQSATPVAPSEHGPALLVVPDLGQVPLSVLLAAGVQVHEVSGRHVAIVDNSPALAEVVKRLPAGAKLLAGPSELNPLLPGLQGLAEAWEYLRGSGVAGEPAWLSEIEDVPLPTGPLHLSSGMAHDWEHSGHHEGALLQNLDEEDKRLITKYGKLRWPSVRSASTLQTSEFAIGTATFAVMFVNGSSAAYKWTPAAQQTVMDKIGSAYAWWMLQNPDAHLQISLKKYVVAVDVDPITYQQSTEGVWINKALNPLGYTSSSYTTNARAFDNDLRKNYGTDWAAVIFAVKGQTFTDGFFAWAYIRGPCMTVTEQNDGWTVQNMDRVVAHETGHLFGADDEYCQPGYSCCSCTDAHSYLGTPNTGCEAGCYCSSLSSTCNGCSSSGCYTGSANCLMRNNSWYMCPISRKQFGWNDADGDGIQDPVDTIPSLAISSATGGTGYISASGTSGESTSNLISYVRVVECRVIDASSSAVVFAWRSATASDGAFNGYSEAWSCTFSGVSTGSYKLEARVSTRWNSTYTATSSTLSVSASTCGSPCDATGACIVPGSGACVSGTCTYTYLASGAACNDGDSCTATSTCNSAHQCTGTVCNTPGRCEASPGTCQSGTCVYSAAVGATCDDSDLCTTGTTCDAAKQCTGGTKATCTATGPCTISGSAVCNPTTGACSYDYYSAGHTCDDSDVCTSGTTCDANHNCNGGTTISCTSPGICDEANSGHCVSGACQYTPKSCTAQGPCADGVCSNGACSYTYKTAGTSCTDSDECTIGTTCDSAHSCVGGTVNYGAACNTSPHCHGGHCGDCNTAADCDDGNACTTDTCANYHCSHVSSCAGTTPFCVSNTCVQCRNAADCGSGGGCATPSCSAGTCSNVLATDYCEINSVCYANEFFTIEPCRMCLTGSATNAWITVGCAEFSCVVSSGRRRRDTFEDAFASDVADALGVPTSYVVVASTYVTNGGDNVDFYVSTGTGSQYATTQELVNAMMALVNDRSSALYDGTVTSNIEPSTFTVVSGGTLSSALAPASQAAYAVTPAAVLLAALALLAAVARAL